MTANSLPMPEQTPTWVSVRTRSLLPTLEPPPPLIFPDLPSPPRNPAFDAPYVLTTHLFPSAHPRSYPDISLPQSLPANSNHAANVSKMQRKELAVKNCEILLEEEDLQGKKSTTSTGSGPGQVEESNKVLWNCVNRYAKRGDLLMQSEGIVLDSDSNSDKRKPRLTLFLAHANGFPKEIWEPTLQHLLGSSSRSSAQIDEVWSWESVQHGDAGLVNSQNLGGLFDWSDNTRDILNFLFNYLPAADATSSLALLPTHLSRLPHDESERRKSSGFRQRTLVAIGHSYGGCTSALAAINYPKLFSSLILVDPIIVRPPNLHNSNYIRDFVLGALQRRDTWASREEAFQLFRQTPFFAAWDPAVLEVYVECGLTANGGGVRLKMPGVHEAIVFAGRLTPYEVWEQMGRLDERIALRWIMPGKPGVGIHGVEQMQDRVWLRPKNASNIMISAAGHLIPQESPRELAQDIDSFLQQKYGTTRANL